ncbi:cystathionine beta-lyase [Oenococcus oeni]|uniref:trans-sulfuration enzyme family protein n=1 Tax=Oenococcus oeni TaxID=1247 RepID=UPI001076C9CF|nr:aminotransferase class I/II-fold pyridoxal phosphate-dependent enzyme [Oenococcus oeni]AVI93936.1 cystathionine gamma-synthase [Oenococcus oeni]SYW01985.1 cystathionine beta-lyase [Oenococcus oeni]SYW03203.1 cystathionine beta-lyase [Oenococcus oeni]SYW18755.1 cystathionine beta-lyase [Oenococcus oeni]VDC14425.1 cystathionine beta-lyase [Oenococcus oeni]
MTESDWTKLIKSTTKIDPLSGAVNTPIQFSSTFHQSNFDQFGEFDYARSGNPTRKVAEDAIAELENGERGFLFSTGMAAISSVLLTFGQGDHLLVSKEVYGGTYRLLNDILPRFGINHSFVDFSDLSAIENSIKKETKAVYIETPSNPTLAVSDIKKISRLAHQNHLIVIADNTFMSPFLQKPLELGADIVVHSATKFLAGHSDLTAGAVVTKTKELGDQVYFVQNAIGATLGVTDAWLLLRSIKTLGVRIQREAASAQAIAEWFEKLGKKVFYPGLPSNPGYEIHKSQAKSGGAVLSVDLGSKEAARKFVEKIKIPVFSVSLGGVETIVSYPPKMSHAELSTDDLAADGITPGLLRISVGLENADDLIDDFNQALED